MPYDFDFDFFDFEQDPGVPEEYKPKKKKEDSWTDILASIPENVWDAFASGVGGAVQAIEETSPASIASSVPATLGFLMKPVDMAAEAMGYEPDRDLGDRSLSEKMFDYSRQIEEGAPDWAKNMSIRSAEEALGMEKGLGETAFEHWSEEAKKDRPTLEPGSAKANVHGILTNVALNAPGMVAAALTRNPKYALGPMGVIAGGEQYGDIRQERPDMPTGVALAGGVAAGATEILTEKIPLDELIKPEYSWGKRILMQAAFDVPGEEVATAIQDGIISYATTIPNLTWGEFVQAMKDTAIQSIGAAGMQGTIAHGIVKWADSQQEKFDKQKEASTVPGDTDGSFLTRRLIESGSLEDVKFALAPENAKLWTPEERSHLERHYARLQATESPTAKLDKTVDDHLQGKTTSTDLLDTFAGEFDNLEGLLQEEPADVNARKIRYGDKQPELDLGTSSMPLFDMKDQSSPSEIVDSAASGEAGNSSTITGTSAAPIIIERRGAKEGGFYAPEGESLSEFGEDTHKFELADTSKIYKGEASYEFVKDRVDMTASDPILDEYGLKNWQQFFDDFGLYEVGNDKWGFSGNENFKVIQDKAEQILKAEGYQGAEWSDEDALNPHQYQVWDRSILKEPGTTAKQPVFADMVKEAARWRGAAMNVDEALGTDKKARLAHSNMTTKGDLDAYLMKKFGIDATTARDVSNELTKQNIPADRSAKTEEFANEPWAKTTGKDMDVSKVVTEEYEPYSRKNPGAGGNYTWKRVDKSKIGKIIKEVPELDYDDYTIDENAAHGQVHVTTLRPNDLRARKELGIDVNEKTKTAITDSFELAPDLRGKGLGRKLWQKIEDDARKHGAERFELWHVMSDAHEFWRKMGFKPIAGGSEDSRTWVKEKEDFLPKAKKTSVESPKGEYGDDKVTHLVTQPVRDLHKKFQQEIKDRLKEKMEKVAAYDGWKWEIGDRVKSKKTGKIWEVTAKSWNDQKNTPTYYMKTRGVKDGEESGMFYAEASHDAFIHLKGPIGSIKEADAEYTTKKADTFYSQMAQVLEKKLPNQGTPAQFRTMINAWAQKGEFKAEELKWSGVDEWLAGKKEKVTKQDVVDYIKANQIQIEEVTKGTQPSTIDEYSFASDYEPHKTIYASYQLPGGQNYKELLLTLPRKNIPSGVDEFGVPNSARANLNQNYHSSHWSEPNVLLHVRMNDRIDVDGKKVLFLEEVQSDWHQEGRRKGYRGEAVEAMLKKYPSLPRDADTWSGPVLQEAGLTVDEISDVIDHFNNAPYGVPQAPFAKTWHELGMKRMLRYAAENGYDRIAWTTGEQQAERYDLSTQIDSLTYTQQSSDGMFPGRVRAYPKRGNQAPLVKDVNSEAELIDVMGKQMAEKIIGNQGQRSEHMPLTQDFRGLDLKVGGEGMKGFYDKILPSFMNKYVKKWGSQVGETEIIATKEEGSNFYDGRETHRYTVNQPDTTVSVHSVDITDAMRKDVLTQGQTLYEPKADYEGGKKAPSFYSNTASMLEQQNETAMPPAEWKKRIEAWGQKFAGIREENQWSGLLEYIDSRSDEKKIPKADLLEYMEETKKGWLQQENEPDNRWSSRNLPGAIPGTEQMWIYSMPGGKAGVKLREDLSIRKIMEKDLEAPDFDAYALGPMEDMVSDGEISAGDWGIFEGKYLLWTAKTQTKAEAENYFIQFMGDLEYDEFLVNVDKNTYASPHFPGRPNVLLHIRTQKMRDAEGRIGIVAETIQSDWHQEGRDKGYGRGENTVTVQETDDGKFQVYLGETPVGVPYNRRQDAEKNIGHPEYLQGHGAVPDAPFKDTWHEQGLKRLIDIAAKDPEVEWVGWTPGEAQAERWGKSEHLDTISYAKQDDGTYSYTGWKGDHVARTWENLPRAEAVKTFGEEAIKEIESQKTHGEPSHTGNVMFNRSIGGDYLKLLYDKKLPKFADKYVKKWGAKVEDIETDAGEIKNGRMLTNSIHAIRITPQMREEITTKGQAFYEPKATYAARAIKALNKAVDFFTGKRVPGPGVLNRSGKTTDRTAAGVRGKEKRHHTVGKMVDDLKNLKPVRLRGADVRTWDEAYEALRITRNKNVEVLQVLYLGAESGKVLYNEACSSRLPGAVHIASPAILASSIHATSLTLKRIAGEGVRVALVHNHPSGDVTASEADKAMTESVGKQLKIRKVEFEGHMIIDHNTYGVIEDGGKYTKRSITDIPAEHAQDPLLSVPVPHDKLGETITRQEHVASIAKDINRGDKYFTILMRSGTKVRGIVNIELGILDEPQQAQAYIKELMVNHGAQDAFVYREEFTDRQVYVLQDLVKGNTIRDAAWEGRWGTQGVAEQGIFPDSSRQFGEDISEQQGKWFDDYGSEFREGKAPYGSETDMIISQAKKNGTYMKAPNGQATKLNPGQWAQVRTKAFKKWFGDWEAAAELQKGIDALAKVVKNQTDAKAAMNNPDLGPVSFYWGNEGTANKAYKDGSGISHIIARRLTEGSTPDDTADTILRIVETIAKGNIVRQYGGKIGRAELSHNGYTAILSKQRFGGKEVWLLTGFKERKEADAKRESYNPEGYAPIDSVGRQKVVAALSDMITKRKDKVNSEISKVVDENGEPLVVYHGTNYSDLNEFYGGWWSEDKRVTREFGKERYSAYLSIKNPIEDYPSYDSSQKSELHKEYELFNGESYMREEIEDDKFESLKDLAAIDGPFREYLVSKGYDGVKVWDESNGGPEAWAWVPFSPTQIKSATANRGTFDANEGSILKDKDAPYGEDLGEPSEDDRPWPKEMDVDEDEDTAFDFGANVEKAIDENPEEYISLDFKDHLDGYMGALQGLVFQGEPGKNFTDADTGEVSWYSSTYPEFMQDQGWTSKEVLSALGHSIKGEEMTDKQRAIVQAAVQQAVDMFYEDLQHWYPNMSGQQYNKAEASIKTATDAFLSRYYTNQKLLKTEKEKADRSTMITKSKYQWEKEKKATENKAWEKGAKAVHAVQDPLIKKLQEDLDATVKQRDKIRETAYRLMNEAKTSTTETKAQEEANRNEIEKLNRKITRLKESLEKARKAQPKQARQSTKALVRIATGQNLNDEVWISEYKLLTEQIRREAMAARQAFAAGNKKGLLAARARYKMMQAQQRAMREIRRETNKIIKDFKKVLKETAEMTPEYADKIKALLEDFDLTRMTGETRLKLEAIRDALVEDPNADIDERTLDTLKRLEKIPIRDISYPGLKAMHDAVMHFATLGKRGPMMIMSQKKVTRDMILKTSIGQMRPAKDVAKEMVDATYSGWKEVKARLAAAKDLYTIHLDTFDNLVESIAGQNSMAYRVLMREIKRGSNERDRIAYDLEDDFMAAQEAFQKRHPEIKDVLGWLSEEVEFAGIKMNRNLALSLYRGWFDPDYQRSIIESGFGLWGSQDRDNPNRVYKIAGDAYGAAVNKLSAADREYADLAIPTIQKSGDLLADKFLEINGYAMPRVEGGIYWRKEVLASERGQDEEQEQMKERFGRPYIFKGMTKKRTGSSAAVWLKPYTVAVREMHKRAADYVGLEEAMGNAAWLMYNSEFRSAFEERYGRPMWRELEKGLKDIAEISTPEASGDMERFFRWLRNNSTIYALAANYGTMLKQLNGAFNYMVYVGPGYLTRAISAYASNPMAVKRLHRSMSVEYRRRRESGYSQDVGNVLQVINKQGTKPSLLTRVGAGGLVPLQQMDIFGVDLGMLAATYQAMDAFKAGKMPDQMRMALDMTDAQVAKLTTAEKAELAYRWADFVTERTQSQNVPEHMSGWQRGGELEKQLSMFFGELQKNLAGFTRGYRAVKRGDPGAKALLLKTILLYAILGTAIDTGVNELRNWFRGRKGDKWWAALLKSATGYLPGAREVVSGVVDMAQGKYYAGGGDTPYERVRNATEKPLKATHGMITATTMKKRRDNAKKFADGLANFVAMTVGIPYPALKEPFRIANREEELRKARAAQRR